MLPLRYCPAEEVGLLTTLSFPLENFASQICCSIKDIHPLKTLPCTLGLDLASCRFPAKKLNYHFLLGQFSAHETCRQRCFANEGVSLPKALTRPRSCPA